MPPQSPLFSQSLLAWFDEFGRHDLPWQQDINPYRVWVSEIMLQQTQVTTVIGYYQKFMQRFPDISTLSEATQDEVLSYWAGLGYYARGRNLHKAAMQIVEKYGGEFPQQFDDILALPGIGRSTAGAILSISLQQRFAILDGNVKRVLSRYFAVEGWPGEKAIENKLWILAEQLTPEHRFNDYTQAIMDLGATLCKRSKPDCKSCPVKQSCQAFESNEVARFPYKKPQKQKPIKQAWFVMAINENQQILLHKRPQKGIWGGLWSLPEFTSKNDYQESLQSQALSEETLIEWEPFRHTFSHYHLDITPVLFKINNEKNPIGIDNFALESLGIAEEAAQYSANNQQWIILEKVMSGEYGVPAPVSKMLKKLNIK